MKNLSFYCKGCDDHHIISVNGDQTWTFNNDFENPTISPSVLSRSGHFMDEWKEGDPCWCDDPEFPFECYRCHLFLKEGKIEYLSDCSHKLAGQTIEVTEISFYENKNS